VVAPMAGELQILIRKLGGFGSPINECTICSVGKGWFGIKE
jgi:hypothetical protein